MSDDLRQRYAEAAGAVRLGWQVTDYEPPGDGRSLPERIADAILAVRDEEMTALRQEIEQLRYERRLLGAARMTLDLVAAGDSSRWEQARREAEDLAQRIVDEIGHPVTDEPARSGPATAPRSHGCERSPQRAPAPPRR